LRGSFVFDTINKQEQESANLYKATKKDSREVYKMRSAWFPKRKHRHL